MSHYDEMVSQLCSNFNCRNVNLVHSNGSASAPPPLASPPTGETEIRGIPWRHIPQVSSVTQVMSEPRLHNHVFRIKIRVQRWRVKTVALSFQQPGIKTLQCASSNSNGPLLGDQWVAIKGFLKEYIPPVDLLLENKSDGSYSGWMRLDILQDEGNRVSSHRYVSLKRLELLELFYFS